MIEVQDDDDDNDEEEEEEGGGDSIERYERANRTITNEGRRWDYKSSLQFRHSFREEEEGPRSKRG